MSDLVEFLRARLDEDEAAGRAATPSPWSYNPGKVWLDGEAFESYDRSKGEEFVGHGGPSPFRGCVAATGPADHAQSMADAAFIARHEPARALAEVDAKRRIIAEHHPVDPCDAHDASFQTVECDTLRLLALPYADHRDYREEWRP